MTFWYKIKELALENSYNDILNQSYAPFHCRVMGVIKITFLYILMEMLIFDKLVHENMFTSFMEGFPKTGLIIDVSIKFPS